MRPRHRRDTRPLTMPRPRHPSTQRDESSWVETADATHESSRLGLKSAAAVRWARVANVIPAHAKSSLFMPYCATHSNTRCVKNYCLGMLRS
jgi:hypothetical protein